MLDRHRLVVMQCAKLVDLILHSEFRPLRIEALPVQQPGFVQLYSVPHSR